jgi:hypothetical protein
MTFLLLSCPLFYWLGARRWKGKADHWFTNAIAAETELRLALMRKRSDAYLTERIMESVKCERPDARYSTVEDLMRGTR